MDHPGESGGSAVLPVHRIRFYDHTPSPITAIQFAPLPLPPATDPSSHKGKGKASSDVLSSTNQTSSGKGRNKYELGVMIIARENGEIEIWQWVSPDPPSIGGNGNWVLEKVLPPTLTHPSISLMVLVIRNPGEFWKKGYEVPKLEDLRLFTAGSDGSDLVERCLHSGRILNIHSIPSAPAWSLSVSPTHTLLCMSTTSPNLHFLSIPPTNTPLEPPPTHLLRSESLPQKVRTVSISWGPPKAVCNSEESFKEGEDDQIWEWRDTYLVTGNSDSSFRKWEITSPSIGGQGGNGRVVLKGRAVVERLGKARGKKFQAFSRTIVWGVGVLPDHTIVTSDSLGNVTFWDGASMAQKQTFKAHKADGMCMVIGPGGRTVFTAGPDQRICQFTLTPSGDNSSWIMTSAKRYHQHDIRALTIFPPYIPVSSPSTSNTIGKIAPILASGGWDMSPILSNAAAPGLPSNNIIIMNPLGKIDKPGKYIFEEGVPRKLSYLGGNRGNGRVCVARKASLVVGRRERGLGVWKVLEGEGGWMKVLEMDLKLRTHLVTTAISQDGKWLALSDLYETKLFKLETTSNGQLHPIRIKSFLLTLLESPLLQHLDLGNTGCGASSLLFTPDGSRLVIGLVMSAQVVVVQLPTTTSGLADNSMDLDDIPAEQDRDQENLEVVVEKCFRRDESGVVGRVIKGLGAGTKKVNGVAKSPLVNGNTSGKGKKGLANGHLPNGHSHDSDESDSDNHNDDKEEEQSEIPSSASAQTHKGTLPWISTLSASDDGQWLATSDLAGKISIFNLDTLQPHAILPTFPSSPATILFPPNTPSLMCILNHNNTISFYHLESRKLLSPNSQISSLNTQLRDQYASLLGGCFEPCPGDNRNTRLVVWSDWWMATIRLDMDLISSSGSPMANGRLGSGSPITGGGVNGGVGGKNKNRKKRAREAREAWERVTATSTSTPSIIDGDSGILGTPRSTNSSLALVSASLGGTFPSLSPVGGFGNGNASGKGGRSSAEDPDFCKITNGRWRSVAFVGWLSQGDVPGEEEGEMMVVERPLGDFMGELPKVFRTGTFGRS